MPQFIHRSRLDASAAEVFKWHTRPGAFERLDPPWRQVQVVERSNGLAEGGRLVLRLHAGPMSLRWVVVHRDIRPGLGFVDEQVEGPFARWRHEHRFLPQEPHGCIVEDHIEYELPAGRLGSLLAEGFTQRRLARLFHYRHEQLRQDLARHRSAPPGPRRIAVTGATGLIGSHLCAFLSSGGHRVDRLVRGMPRPGSTDIFWKPSNERIDASPLEGVDAVVHLAGESIATMRWNDRKRQAIRESRIEGTRLLAEALAGLEHPPEVLVSASAVGYYGDGGERVLTEESPPGDLFLSEVCRAWEAAAEPARQAGIRVVHPRIGMVLAGDGGALPWMLPAFRLGLGGPLGSGEQYMSWIDIDDLIAAIHFVIFRDDVCGPVNAVSPQPVTNRQFTRTLVSLLHRWTFVSAPAPLLRALTGGMAENVLLPSQRAVPARLRAAGFEFFHTDLEACLRRQLGLAGRTASVPGAVGREAPDV